jgi:hypothetical protein
MKLNNDEEDYSTPNLSQSYKNELLEDTSENELRSQIARIGLPRDSERIWTE